MDLHTAKATLNDVAPHDLTTLAWEALDVVLLELDRRYSRITELETIERRAQEWDHNDATEAERNVARHILDRPN